MTNCNGETILLAFIFIPIGLLLWGAVAIVAILVIENAVDAIRNWRHHE